MMYEDHCQSTKEELKGQLFRWKRTHMRKLSGLFLAYTTIERGRDRKTETEREKEKTERRGSREKEREKERERETQFQILHTHEVD